jgi:hypothetical protein
MQFLDTKIYAIFTLVLEHLFFYQVWLCQSQTIHCKDETCISAFLNVCVVCHWLSGYLKHQYVFICNRIMYKIYFRHIAYLGGILTISNSIQSTKRSPSSTFQHIHATKQDLSSAYLNIYMLPNRWQSLSSTYLGWACIRGNSYARMRQATKHTLKSF